MVVLISFGLQAWLGSGRALTPTPTPTLTLNPDPHPDPNPNPDQAWVISLGDKTIGRQAETASNLLSIARVLRLVRLFVVMNKVHSPSP